MKKAIFLLIFVFLFINVYAEKLDVKGQISDEFKQIQKDSEDYRINRDSVKLLVRKNGLGKEFVTQKLIEKFKTGDTINTKTSGNWGINIKDDFNSVVGDGWDLTVFADGSFVDETLASNIAYFGREKNGLMFVGNSSMIIVEFSNDRKPVSFYYKWKDYEELEDNIEIASREEIDYRISSFSSMNFGNVKNLDVRLFCGLYDDSEFVQPACEIRQSGEISEGEFVGIKNIIPAGKNHAEGGNWGELKILNSYGEICRESDITGEIFPENEK